MRLVTAIRLPIRPTDWRLVGAAVRRVLARPAYVAMALATAGAVLTAVAVARNVELVVRVVVGGSLPFENRAAVLAAMYPFTGSYFEGWAAITVVAFALLVGLDVAMLVYHARKHGATLGLGAGGSAGLIGALLTGLGAGCALCGTSLLAGLLSLLGVAGGGLLLPFEGVGFTLLAVVLVLVSIAWVAAGMHGGMRRQEVSEQ